MGWQPAINLTTTFNALPMFGAPACYVYAQYTQNVDSVDLHLEFGPTD